MEEETNTIKKTGEDRELFFGTKFKFKVPEWNRHEGQVANFMLTTDTTSSKLNVMYVNNEAVCTCKDGWVKFEDILSKVKHARNALNITVGELKSFLKEYYNEQFEEQSFEILNEK